MTPLRAGVSLLLVGMVCLVVVLLRAERIRLDAQAQAHLAELVEHRRQAWAIRMQLARLRSPEQIRERVARWGISLDAGANSLRDEMHDRHLAENRR